MNSPDDHSHPHVSGAAHTDYAEEQVEAIDWRGNFRRLGHGLGQTLGLGLLGMVIAASGYLINVRSASVSTSLRVMFAFKGYQRGEYPDHSKFQTDDLGAPEIIGEALKRRGLEMTNGYPSRIRAALNIEGIIPPNIVKEHDRLRANGVTPAPYIPDEYSVTLVLPRGFPLSSQQRALLLNDIVDGYRQNFQRTYGSTPLSFGTAFDTLRNDDFPEYELILNEEVQSITDYLNQQIEQAKSFRSPTTNLSFSDLLKQTQLFSQIQLNETLGLIYEHGLSRNRTTAMVKMDYYLRTLEDQEQKAIEEEKVVDDLLTKAQERSQNYVLGIKSQAGQQRPEYPILDQGLIDSLLVNDAYNFLVRKALDAGLAVKRIQADKAQLFERRKNMETFLKSTGEDQSAIIAQVQKSLADLETSYKELISNIRQTHADFARQQFADAIRVSMQAETESLYRKLIIACGLGLFLGVALGMGLSLMGVYMGRHR